MVKIEKNCEFFILDILSMDVKLKSIKYFKDHFTHKYKVLFKEMKQLKNILSRQH